MSAKSLLLGGIYFVVPFPDRWEVCAFRFDRYPDVGHAMTWELMVAPQLALRWALRMHTSSDLDRRPELVTRLSTALAPLYDSVPRGRLVPPSRGFPDYRLFHGHDLPLRTGISRRTVGRAFGVVGKLRWLRDEHETRNADSTDQLVSLLPVAWPG